jgi:hypothetical protein
VGNGVGFSCSEVLVLMNLVVLWELGFTTGGNAKSIRIKDKQFSNTMFNCFCNAHEASGASRRY